MRKKSERQLLSEKLNATLLVDREKREAEAKGGDACGKVLCDGLLGGRCQRVRTSVSVSLRPLFDVPGLFADPKLTYMRTGMST